MQPVNLIGRLYKVLNCGKSRLHSSLQKNKNTKKPNIHAKEGLP